ncbi:hypothetical protein D3C78_946520 [compost metagenome]
MYAVCTDFKGANSLVNGLLEGASNRHHFTSCLHLSTKLAVGINEFVKRPAWNLRYDVVERRLEACVSLTRNRVYDFIKRVSDSDFCCHFCNRVAGCFGSKRRRTADTRVNLNDIILIALRIKRELHVTAALNVQCANNLK